jgi:nucleotide-binding universal stress UspA family protein
MNEFERKNRILALIDFSPYSENVIKKTAVFSDILNAEVVFIHQIPEAYPVLADTISKKAIIDAEKNDAIKNLKNIAQNHFHKKAFYLVSGADVMTMINELKNNKNNDFVFLGLKGTGLLKQLFIGSTTSKIIDNVHLPTFAIPLQKEEITSLPEHLTIAISEKNDINHDQLLYLLSELKTAIKTIEFIHISVNKNSLPSNVINELHEKYKAYTPTFNFFEGDDVFSSLQDYMKNKKNTYLIVQQGSKTITDMLFRKFVINELIYKATIPLIVLSI